MGDRANVFVKDETEVGRGVFLYTHWDGATLPHTVKLALTRGTGRWDDAPYLTRIIFCEMVRGDLDGDTGYGISATQLDNGRPIIVIDTENKKISFENTHDWAFEDYVKLTNEEIDKAWRD